MINVCWFKAIRDLLLNKARTIMVILAIAIGTMGLGSIMDAYSILTREMQTNYLETNPASFTLWVDPIDERLLQSLRADKDIQEVEQRKTVMARIQTKSAERRTIQLFIIEDFAHIHVDTFKSESGSWPPSKGEVLIERNAFSIGDTKIGDQIAVKIPASDVKSLKVSGSVHAPGLAPASMENSAYGFITKETLSELGDSSGFNELQVVVATNSMDEDHIRNVAYRFKEWCQINGYTVSRVDVPRPGMHPHADQMNSFLFILQAFGILALISSGLLTAIKNSPGARVVTTSSSYHRYGIIDFEHLEGSKGLKKNKTYHSMEAYKQSKLANLLFARELQRRFESFGIDAISIGTHPGYSRTNLHSIGPQMSGSHVKAVLMKLMSVFAQSAEMGTLPTLCASTSADVCGGDYIGPNRFFSMHGNPESVQSSQTSQDAELAKQLWKVSEEMTGVRYL